MAVHRPDKAGAGSLPQGTPARPLGPAAAKEASTALILRQPANGAVVDLDAWRWRPWLGWWGGMELRCWTVAERSRRSA
jgi:hypothetical protein